MTAQEIFVYSNKGSVRVSAWAANRDNIVLDLTCGEAEALIWDIQMALNVIASHATSTPPALNETAATRGTGLGA